MKMAMNKIKNLQELIEGNIDGEVVEQNVTTLLPPGENYGSVIYKVDFKVKKGEKEEIIHAVAKCTPNNKITQEMFNTQVTFKSEIAWYTTVIPTLKEFLREQGVEKELDFFQNFLGARISLDPNSDMVDLDGVILTENLNIFGYKNEDRHLGFDLPTTQAILRDLATFHAVPLAIKQKNPNLFDKKIRSYLPNFYLDKNLQENYKNDILEIFERIPQCSPLIEKVKHALKNSDPFGDHPGREPWNTAIHNDFWMNNVMIKKENIIKVMILDFQEPAYGSPGSELVFFLLTSVNLETLKAHFDDLVKFYYNEFIRNLNLLGVSTDLFPFDMFLEEIDRQATSGQLSHALGHIKMMLDEKGAASFNPADENFKFEDLKKHKHLINERVKAKYSWVAMEAAKRSWI